MLVDALSKAKFFSIQADEAQIVATLKKFFYLSILITLLLISVCIFVTHF